MAKTFTTFPTRAFKGAAAPQKIDWCAPGSAKQGPVGVAFDIVWAQYQTGIIAAADGGLQFGVTVDLNPSVGRLEQIKGVYVDNTDVNARIYIKAFDTGHTISVPAGAVGFYPLLTSQPLFTIYTDGYPTTVDKLTRVIFTNVPLPPYETINEEIDKLKGVQLYYYNGGTGLTGSGASLTFDNVVTPAFAFARRMSYLSMIVANEPNGGSTSTDTMTMQFYLYKGKTISQSPGPFYEFRYGIQFKTSTSFKAIEIQDCNMLVAPGERIWVRLFAAATSAGYTGNASARTVVQI